VFSESASSEEKDSIPLRSRTCSHVVCNSCVQNMQLADWEQRVQKWLPCPVCRQEKAFNDTDRFVCHTMCTLVRSILKKLPDSSETPGVTTNTSEAAAAATDSSPPSSLRPLDPPLTSKGAHPSAAPDDETMNKRSAKTGSRGCGMDSSPPSPKKPKRLSNRKDGALETSSESENEGSGVHKKSIPISDNEKEDEEPVDTREYFAVKLEIQDEYETETPAVKRDDCAVKLERSDSEKEDTTPVIKAEYVATKVESDSKNSGKEDNPIIKTEDLAVQLERGNEKEYEQSVKRESFSADESDEDVTLDAQDLDAGTTSIGRMTLSNAARNSGIQGLATMIDAMPSRFEEVLLLMDFLFDCEDQDSYHHRLFIGAGSRTNGILDGLRKGMSTRQKLRNFKTKNPRHPAVSWHVAKKEWVPPTKDALEHFIRLLEAM
jgi:hypothetical protein